MSNNTLTIQTVTITPEMAVELLAKNTRNRSISQELVKRFKLSMERDEWALNGEAIKIAPDGRILDGQHRLTACVESGKPFQTLIITGIPDETQYTMDTGKARSLGDMLKLKGETNYIGVASLVASLIRTQRWGVKAGIASTAGYTLTIKEQLDFLEENPWVRDLERKGYGLRSTGLTGRLAGVLYHVFSTIDQDDADFFFARLSDGVDLHEGSPILALRNWLILNRLDRDSVAKANRIGLRGIGAHVYMGAVTIKAWNAFREGREVKVLAFRIGGAKPENFPEPR